jgi:ABC-type sugar transport system permease subunit
MCKNNIKLNYLTFIHCTCKSEKHKQSFLIENYEQTFPNKEHKQSNADEKHKQPFPAENYNRTFHNKQYSSAFVVVSVFVVAFVPCSIVRCSIRSL